MAERIEAAAREIADRLNLLCLFYSDEAAETSVPEITAILRKHCADVERERDELRGLLVELGIALSHRELMESPNTINRLKWAREAVEAKARELSQPPAPARPEE